MRPPLTSKLETYFEDKFLKPLGVKYEKQKRLGIFIYDFYLPDFKILIEIQGTYWHADPRVYKSEDLNRMQRKNVKRDENKAVVAKKFGFKLLSFYEGDIYFNPQTISESMDSEVQ